MAYLLSNFPEPHILMKLRYLSVPVTDIMVPGNEYAGQRCAFVVPGGCLLGSSEARDTLRKLSLAKGEGSGPLATEVFHWSRKKIVVTRDLGLHGALEHFRLIEISHSEVHLHAVHERHDDTPAMVMTLIDDERRRLDLDSDELHAFPVQEEKLSGSDLERHCMRPVVHQHGSYGLLIGTATNTPVFGRMDPGVKGAAKVSIALEEGFMPCMRVLENIPMPAVF